MNTITITGRLGKEPDLTYTSSGTPMVKFTLADSQKWKDQATQESKETTHWFSVVAWSRLAEICQQLLHKGDKVLVTGRMASREYIDKDNSKRMVWEVHISTMEVLSSISHDTKPTETKQPVSTSDDDVPF